jgi:hypoxanthine-DNA glycosylase
LIPDQARIQSNMTEVSGFPPVAGDNAIVLVLGSMPGVRSLEEQQYYAQPRNAFWTIMDGLFQAGVNLPYQKRLDVLRASGIALWDVLQSCERPGSLDSSINESTAMPNDFVSFFEKHDRIRQIFFNGQTASRIYLGKVQPNLDSRFASIPCVVLPSTSPAHASMTIGEKARKWSIICNAIS